MKELPREWLGDEQLRAEFAEKGYVMLPLLDEADLKTLHQLYHSLQRGGNQGFFTSMNLENLEDRQRVDTTIKSLLADKARALLPGYRPLLGNFTVKAPEGNSELRLHLDWSVLDERKHRTVGIWMPLSDVDEHNGALGVLEGSHRAGHSRRGSMVNFATYDEREAPDGFLASLKARFSAKLLTVKAGTAVIYDLSLAHFSPPNLTSQVRLATNLMMIPEDAQPIHYFREGDREIRMLEVDDAFFITRNMAAPPDTAAYSSHFDELDEHEAVEEQYGTEVVIGENEYEIDRSHGPAPRSLSEALARTKRSWWQMILGRNR